MALYRGCLRIDLALLRGGLYRLCVIEVVCIEGVGVPEIVLFLFLYSMSRSAGQVASVNVRFAMAENLFLYYLTIDTVAVPLLSFIR